MSTLPFDIRNIRWYTLEDLPQYRLSRLCRG